MGILEPETLSLFDGWLRLLFFTAGACNLIITIESYLDKEEFYENILVHIFAVLGAIWFTCELIYIPNEIFGNVTEEGGLIDILRLPWSVAMGILCCMSMGVIHESDLLTEDVIQWARIPLIGLSLLLGITEQLLGNPVGKWDHENNICHGWKVMRWYERKEQPNAIEIISNTGISINMLIGLFMIITPGISMYAEVIQFIDDGVTTNERITHASVVVINLLLINQAVLLTTTIKVVPVHLFTVLTNVYIASKASEKVGSFAFFLPICAVLPYVFIELVLGSVFGDYVEWFVINARPRTGFRFVYTVAIWTGVFSIVVWIVGWFGDWITLDIADGTIVEAVLSAFKSLEEIISKFLYNLITIVNFLTVCGKKSIDLTLTKPELLDPYDKYGDGVELGEFVMTVEPYIFSVFNGTAGKPNVVSKECCVCDHQITEDLRADSDLHFACAATAGLGATGPMTCSNDEYFKEVLLGNEQIEDIDAFLKRPGVVEDGSGRTIQCQDKVPATLPTLSQEQQDEIDADNNALSALQAESIRDQEVFNPNGVMVSPAVINDDGQGWTDPAKKALMEDSTCEDIQCGVFIAVMAAATASAFIPFVGGAISFAVKTAAKIAFKVFRFAKTQYQRFIRMNNRRKQFRKKRIQFANIISAFDKAKAIAAKGIQATEDLLYPFLGLFLLGFVSFFSAFWRREDSGSARGLLGGVIIGLLIANVVSMLLVRFIPKAMEGIVHALPEELIKIDIKVHTGWRWMEYGVFISLCSSGFWGLAMLLGQPKDACDDYKKQSATIRPIDDEEKVVGKISSTLALPKWSGKGIHPQIKDSYEPVSASKNHPLMGTITPFFNNSGGTKRSTAWINNFIWFIPIMIIIWYAFDNGQAVFKVSSTIQSEVHGVVTAMAGEEGSQEFVVASGDDTAPGNICDIVESAVRALVTAAGNAVGKELGDAITIVRDWFTSAFSSLRTLMLSLVDLPDLPIWFLVDNTTLIMAFGCPILACATSVLGLVLALLPLPPIFYEFVSLDILRSLQYMLAIAGISVALTMYGMSASLAAVPIPLFNLKIETTKVLLNAVLCNIIILVNYLNNIFNGIVPLYDQKQE